MLEIIFMSLLSMLIIISTVAHSLLLGMSVLIMITGRDRIYLEYVAYVQKYIKAIVFFWVCCLAYWVSKLKR